MINNPYDPRLQVYTPLRMVGMSVISFLTDNKESFGKDLENNKSERVPYQVGSVVFNMIRPPKISFNYVPSLEMGETEVTQELFQAVMGWNGSKFKDSPQNPVETVTSYDCVSFCNALSKLLGLEECYRISDEKKNGRHIIGAKVKWDESKNGFRLPTDNEWVFFAKAGTNNEWSGTNDENALDQYAWYEKNSGDKTHPVGDKLPNEWGLYDMSGNVWEWCLYDPEINTLERVDVVRGGSYGDNAYGCWVASRNASVALRYYDQGFRLCRSFG
jgi:formylglycine-generating enzyme required for sulfatase activity